MALPEGFEVVPPFRRASSVNIDKDGKVFLPVALKRTFGLDKLKEEGYQVLFNAKTFEVLLQLVAKVAPGSDSAPLHWTKGRANADASQSLRFNIAPIIALYSIRIIPGSVAVSFDAKERRIHFNLTPLKETKLKDVKELVCPETVQLMR